MGPVSYVNKEDCNITFKASIRCQNNFLAQMFKKPLKTVTHD